MNNIYFCFPPIPETPFSEDIERNIAVDTFFPLTILDPYGNLLSYEMKKCCKKFKKGKRCKKCPNQ